MNWEQLAASSHYKTAAAVKMELEHGNIQEAVKGVRELIEALSISEKRALKSQLIRLMLHVIKWKSQPDKRTWSWIVTIQDARDEILDIQEETPSLNNAVIEALWGKAFIIAQRNAQAEMQKKSPITALSWKEVFEENYAFDDNNI
jgi:hypothetical protein